MLRDKLAKLGTSLSSKLRGVGGKIGDYLSFYACILAVGWEKVKVVIVCNSLKLFLFLTISPKSPDLNPNLQVYQKSTMTSSLKQRPDGRTTPSGTAIIPLVSSLLG